MRLTTLVYLYVLFTPCGNIYIYIYTYIHIYDANRVHVYISDNIHEINGVHCLVLLSSTYAFVRFNEAIATTRLAPFSNLAIVAICVISVCNNWSLYERTSACQRLHSPNSHSSSVSHGLVVQSIQSGIPRPNNQYAEEKAGRRRLRRG